MSRAAFYERIDDELAQIDKDGLTKTERPLQSAQGGVVEVTEGRRFNLCANNYLGLADSDELINAAEQGMRQHGFGMASVRFICGTTPQHRALEQDVASYLSTGDSITFAACFDANGAVFEPLLRRGDAIISDSLNHASIIDGIRLCKANRYRFATRDLGDLEFQLKQSRQDGAGTILIATDGVFSMDGYIADLAGICELADTYDALVMVDDCHATGLVGPQGRGTPALHGVEDRVDIVTSTFGKALGGAMGGFVAGRQGVIDLLRQRARPYLFSNALSPALVAGARKGIELAIDGEHLRAQLNANAEHFRSEMTKAGFSLEGEGHPIIPVMIGEARPTVQLAARLEELGVYVTPFSYPVVPKGTARIRTQMTAAHTASDIDACLSAFVQAASELDLIGATK